MLPGDLQLIGDSDCKQLGLLCGPCCSGGIFWGVWSTVGALRGALRCDRSVAQSSESPQLTSRKCQLSCRGLESEREEDVILNDGCRRDGAAGGMCASAERVTLTADLG